MGQPLKEETQHLHRDPHLYRSSQVDCTSSRRRVLSCSPPETKQAVLRCITASFTLWEKIHSETTTEALLLCSICVKNRPGPPEELKPCEACVFQPALVLLSVCLKAPVSFYHLWNSNENRHTQGWFTSLVQCYRRSAVYPPLQR